MGIYNIPQTTTIPQTTLNYFSTKENNYVDLL